MVTAGEVGMIVLTALWLMLPAYLANMAPVFVGGGRPIDMGRNWRDGKRILGDGKTWRGLLLGPLVAAALTGPLHWLTQNTAWGLEYGFPGWGQGWRWFALAYVMGLGALVGDALESFVKRRTGRERGERWFPWDQLDFIAGALLFAFLLSPSRFLELFTWPRLLVILLLTPGLHLLVNLLGYKLGLKKVPW
jgi:CDP-2,3-bis-(O-geranylgeranyl)-sn-glycerol synthase